MLALLYKSLSGSFRLGLLTYAIVIAVALWWLLREWRGHGSNSYG
jgi:hypothetical protein